jgi:hypothetical protein
VVPSKPALVAQPEVLDLREKLALVYEIAATISAMI